MAFKIDKFITSPLNPVYRDLRECLTSKGIRKHGLFVISGERAVRETLERFPHLARSLLLCRVRHRGTGPMNSLSPSGYGALMAGTARAKECTADRPPGFSVLSLSSELFDELDVTGTHTPLLLARAPEINEARLDHPPQGLEILCSLGDPANVGALLRSAAAFGASKVILLKESASPFHPKAVRAASASTLLTALERGPSIDDLATKSHMASEQSHLVALDMQGETISDFQWPRNVRILIGEEGRGVPSSTAFKYVSIPMANAVESLNATVASSIALYTYRAQHP